VRYSQPRARGASIRTLFTWLRHAFADSAGAPQKLTAALPAVGEWTLEIINRHDAPPKGFMLLPRRWMSARTFV
jgi:transposase